MKSVSEIIVSLISKHECVIVPEWGGFISSAQSAQISNNIYKILPPYYNILFNQDLKHNDGLLASELIKTLNVDYPTALAYIDNFVSESKISLNLNKRVDWIGLGYFYINAESKVQFVQEIASGSFIDFIGLSELNLNPLQEKTISTEAPLVNKLPKKEDSNNEPKVRSLEINTWLKRAAVLIPAGIAIGFSVYFGVKSNQNTSFANLNPFANVSPLYQDIDYLPKQESATAHLNIKDSAGVFNLDLVSKPNIKPLIVKVEAIADSTRTVNLSLTKVQTPAVENYHVVAGCFSDINNANNFIADLKTKGFNPMIAGQTPTGMYRISLGGFDTRSDADILAQKAKSNLTGVWVWKKSI